MTVKLYTFRNILFEISNTSTVSSNDISSGRILNLFPCKFNFYIKNKKLLLLNW